MDVFLALLTSFLWAVTSIINAKTIARVDPITAAFGSTVFGGLLLIPVVVLSGESSTIASLGVYPVLFFALAGLVNNVLARTSVYVSVQRLGVLVTFPIASTGILIAPLAAALVFAEQLTPRLGFGVVLVFVGIVLAVRAR